MFQKQANCNGTILDYLNGDCWRNVLSYVPVLDIILTERTSRRWQRAVLIYLQGVRFRINSLEEENDEDKPTHIEFPSKPCNSRLLEYCLPNKDYESFVTCLNKLGSLLVAIYCKDLDSLKIIRAKCPNLEALTMLHVYDLPLSKDELITHCLNKDFKCLKRLCFYGSYASDDCVSQFIGQRALEELEFHSCYDMTGRCLNTVKLSNIKSLVFDICYSLQSKYILSSISDLKELTKLVLHDIPNDICCEIQPMLDKMEKLQWLEIHHTKGCAYSQASIVEPIFLVFEPLCQLSCLKHLSTDLLVTDNAVQAITKCCKDLRSLELSDCVLLSSQAVDAICCNAGTHLTTLRLRACESLTDDNIVACISACPNLIWLSVSGINLTHALPARAAAVRHNLRLGQPLQLHFSGSNMHLVQIPEEYDKELILDIDYDYDILNIRNS